MGNAPNGADANAWAPEKYRVMGADGKLNVEETAKKVAGGYAELNTRMKDVGLPPESPDKYELAPAAEADKELFASLMGDEGAKKFITDAHAKGYSNGQLNLAMNMALDIAKNIGAGVLEETKEECVTALNAVWKGGQAVIDKNLATGRRAVEAFGGAIGIKFEDVEKEGLANNPVFCRIMAAVGAEMGEDTTVNDANGNTGGKSFEETTAELRKELEALDLHDPKRKGLQEKLDGLYQRKYPAAKPVFKGAA